MNIWSLKMNAKIYALSWVKLSCRPYEIWPKKANSQRSEPETRSYTEKPVFKQHTKAIKRNIYET